MGKRGSGREIGGGDENQKKQTKTGAERSAIRGRNKVKGGGYATPRTEKRRSGNDSAFAGWGQKDSKKRQVRPLMGRHVTQLALEKRKRNLH